MFAQEVIPTDTLEWDLALITKLHARFEFHTSDCLHEAGIKAIFSLLVTARKHKDGVLMTYLVIQTEELPPPTEDEISRVVNLTPMFVITNPHNSLGDYMAFN